jgi:hypothetical protein
MQDAGFRQEGPLQSEKKAREMASGECTCTDIYEVGFVSLVTSVLLRLVMVDMYFLFHACNGWDV